MHTLALILEVQNVEFQYFWGFHKYVFFSFVKILWIFLRPSQYWTVFALLLLVLVFLFIIVFCCFLCCLLLLVCFLFFVCFVFFA